MAGFISIRLAFRTLLVLAGAALLLPAVTARAGSEAHDRTCMTGSGTSMLPTLPAECRLVVVRRPFAEIKADEVEGDIIATRARGGSVTHRVVARRPDGSLVTRGDNNARTDSFVTTESNYVGVVIGFEKPGTVGELQVPAPRITEKTELGRSFAWVKPPDSKSAKARDSVGGFPSPQGF